MTIPAWCWILLVIFMCANFCAGVAYVILHAIRGGRLLQSTGNNVVDILSRLDHHTPRISDTTPVFTRPLSDASDKYAATREKIEQRHIDRAQRHDNVLLRWKNYTEQDLSHLASNIEINAQLSDQRADHVD